MISTKPLMDKINEIEKRMNYVIDNWESDKKVTPQEIRFICVAYLYGLYKNKKVRDLAKGYLRKIEERKRLNSELLLTTIASGLIINEDFLDHWRKLKDLLDRSDGVEKYNLMMQFLIILTPKAFEKFEDKDKTYIKDLLNELETQDIEKKLFSYWTEKRLFSNEGEITLSQEQIRHLKEYLLWEIITQKEYGHQKEKLRKKFIPEILKYKVDKIDWIVFLIYHFFKKQKLYFITENELNKKITDGIRSRINRKVWFPVVSSLLFLVSKMWKENIIKIESLGQIAILTIGIFLLVFEESLPTKNIKEKKITSGLPAAVLIISALLWNFGISWMLNLVVSIIGGFILWIFIE